MHRRAPFLRLLLPLSWAGSAAVLCAQQPPQDDLNKVSAYANKTFDFKTIDAGKPADLSKTAPGFDKEYKMGVSDWTSKQATLGGRDIYAPTLDFSKVYPTSDSSLFQGISPLSGQASSLGVKTSPFSAATPAPGFDRVLDDTLYRGREASIIREAMDRLDQQSQASLAHDALARQTASNKEGEAPSWAREGGSRAVKPLISIDDVKLLVDKDITAASAGSAASATSAAPAAPGQNRPAAPPAIKAAP